jgi:glyoxylase-like metal-dependent hydrolase (beta-lactamase superfamily II)
MGTQSETPAVEVFRTSGGASIYQLPLEAFPGMWGYAYLVLADGEGGGPYRVLIDTGSGFGRSDRHLEEGLRAAGRLAGVDLNPASLTHILITHGHIDHIGGLTALRPRTAARIGVHELDRRILTNYEERLTVIARRLGEYLVEAGVAEADRERLLSMYQITKALFHSVQVDFTYEAQGMRLGPFEFLHVPGHSAGHVIIRLHDVIFSGDHVLSETSPHQAPEHLSLSTGLDHYLKSLETLRAWAGRPRWTLGGHKAPVADLAGRIGEIRRLHEERLQKVLEHLAEPHTINEVSACLFPGVQGYNEILAVEETGAHVEYLYQRGLLGIANLDELDQPGPLPIQYHRLVDRFSFAGEKTDLTGFVMT